MLDNLKLIFSDSDGGRNPESSNPTLLDTSSEQSGEDIICYFDGSCAPYNPGGRAGYGYIIYNKEIELHRGHGTQEAPQGYLTSNNLAEYAGMKAVLSYLINYNLNNLKIIVYGDSKLVIQQMRGNWRIKRGSYVEVARQCQSLLRLFKNITFKWIPREENTIADSLSLDSTADLLCASSLRASKGTD